MNVWFFWFPWIYYVLFGGGGSKFGTVKFGTFKFGE